MKQEIGFEKARRHVSAQSIIPFERRPTCTIAKACNAAGLGKTKFYEVLGQGMIETLRIGRRRLVRVRSLLHFLENALTNEQGYTSGGKSFSASARTRRVPSIPDLEAARPLTHIEALEFDDVPGISSSWAAAMSASNWLRPAGVLASA